jgi:hypothetical protein
MKLAVNCQSFSNSYRQYNDIIGFVNWNRCVCVGHRRHRNFRARILDSIAIEFQSYFSVLIRS